MPELGTLGSVRGDASNGIPYRDKVLSPRTPTRFPPRKATRTEALARAPGRSGEVQDPGMYGRSLTGNREISRPAGNCRAGPHREGEEP